MFIDEAKTVLRIMASVDDYHVVHASRLFQKFIKEFPIFDDLAKEIWQREFGNINYDKY